MNFFINSTNYNLKNYNYRLNSFFFFQHNYNFFISFSDYLFFISFLNFLNLKGFKNYSFLKVNNSSFQKLNETLSENKGVFLVFFFKEHVFKENFFYLYNNFLKNNEKFREKIIIFKNYNLLFFKNNNFFSKFFIIFTYFLINFSLLFLKILLLYPLFLFNNYGNKKSITFKKY